MEVLDQDKRSWNINADTGSNPGIFFSEVAIPLRQLRDRQTHLKHALTIADVCQLLQLGLSKPSHPAGR